MIFCTANNIPRLLLQTTSDRRVELAPKRSECGNHSGRHLSRRAYQRYPCCWTGLVGATWAVHRTDAVNESGSAALGFKQVLLTLWFSAGVRQLYFYCGLPSF